MPWGFIIGAAASLLGSSMESDAAEDAAATNASAQEKALALQRQMYEEGVARQKPFLDTGTEFFNKLAQLHRDPSSANAMMQMDPGYGFRLNEGLKTLNRQAAARGGLISGGALKAAQRYGQDYASQEFGNAYNRLAKMAETGPRAAGVMSDLGTTFANQATNAYGNIGQTNANALLARGSAYGRGVAGVANQLGRWSNTWGGSGGDDYGDLTGGTPYFGPGGD